VGIDIDPQAVAASRANAILNQCDETKAEFFETHVADRAGPKNGAWVDVVVANILANPLIILAPLLMRATRKGGHIALSGILMEQAEDVMQIYRQWFDIHITREQAGWALLTGTRK
jgi:ribosomal protein L11 methyltransferase